MTIEMPTVDPDQLKKGVTNFVGQQINEKTQDVLGGLNSLSDNAKGFGITGLDGFIETLKNLFKQILVSFGISVPALETHPTSTALTTPPAEPSNPAAAEAAAKALAASNKAGQATHVAGGETPTTPTVPVTPTKPQRSV